MKLPDKDGVVFWASNPNLGADEDVNLSLNGHLVMTFPGCAEGECRTQICKSDSSIPDEVCDLPKTWEKKECPCSKGGSIQVAWVPNGPIITHCEVTSHKLPDNAVTTFECRLMAVRRVNGVWRQLHALMIDFSIDQHPPLQATDHKLSWNPF